MASVRATLGLGTAARQIHELYAYGPSYALADGQLLERFVTRGDEAAFASLVARHGPMVLSVCRGVLANPDDTEDAFQATFLVLVRRAGSVRRTEALEGWLHRVAYRVAVRANVDAARRRREEVTAGVARAMAWSGSNRDAGETSVVHEELARLPERYRRPLVLCHLEGKTHAQAASELRWGEATVRRRLAEARGLLRSRLVRRGVGATAGALIAALEGTASSSAAVPPAWAAAAVRAACGGGGRGSAVALAGQCVRSWLPARAVVLLAGLVAVGAASWSVMVAGSNPADARSGDRPRAGATSPAAAPAARDEPRPDDFRGAVVDAAGRPAAGARVVLVVPVEAETGSARWVKAGETVAGSDGRFRLAGIAAPGRDASDPLRWAGAQVVAELKGFGPGWADADAVRRGEVSLRLVPDDVPLRGRLLDTEGRPVRSAVVTVRRVATPKGADLSAYLKMVADGKDDGNGRLLADHWFGAFPGRPASVTTGDDGRFSLEGFGRERLVELEAEAPATHSARFVAATREGPAVGGPGEKEIGSGHGRVHGARFDLVLAPGRSVTGVVRDKASGQPIAGMTVGGFDTNARATTDASGRYTLTGLPKAKSYSLFASAHAGQPYFVTCVRVPDTPGLAPLTADFACVRGIPYRLKVTDRETGKPVQAYVSYNMVYPNPHVSEVPGYEPANGFGAIASAHREADGTYTGGVMPGPGALLVRVAGSGYRAASVEPTEFFTGKPSPAGKQPSEYGNRLWVLLANGPGSFGAPSPQSQWAAIVLTNPPEGSGPLTLEAVLERDAAHPGTVLDPDGRLLAGARLGGLVEDGETSGPQKQADFQVTGLVPGRTRRLTAVHDGKGLAGFLLVTGGEKGPYVIRMKPAAAVTGRLVDRQGKPRPNVQFMAKDWQGVLDNPAFGLIPGGKTDAEGRFRFDALVAGLEYDAVVVNVNDGGDYGVVFEHLILKPGETRDLGDVRSVPPH